MALTVPRYGVIVADENHPDDPDHATYHEIRILNGDRLRAELEAPAHGIFDAEEVPQHVVSLWIWAALMRTHIIEQKFGDFLPRLLHWGDLDKNQAPDAPAEPGSPGDPTRPGALTTAPSNSPSTSATSAGGSTPPPTTD